jgi:hypothetical protein
MSLASFDRAALWDAETYYRGGQYPWTIFAYPVALADERRLPRDEESVRYLAALLAAGAVVGIWYFPASETVYFACPFEERERIDQIVEGLERQGLFPKNFAANRTNYLFSLG